MGQRRMDGRGVARFGLGNLALIKEDGTIADERRGSTNLEVGLGRIGLDRWKRCNGAKPKERRSVAASGPVALTDE